MEKETLFIEKNIKTLRNRLRKKISKNVGYCTREMLNDASSYLWDSTVNYYSGMVDSDKSEEYIMNYICFIACGRFINHHNKQNKLNLSFYEFPVDVEHTSCYTVDTIGLETIEQTKKEVEKVYGKTSNRYKLVNFLVEEIKNDSYGFNTSQIGAASGVTSKEFHNIKGSKAFKTFLEDSLERN